MENFLIKYLIFTIIFLCCCLIYFHKHKTKLTLQDAEKSMDKFFQYLDKFYVVNIWLTTFNVILYIALNLLLVICLRIYILKDLLKINDNISLRQRFLICYNFENNININNIILTKYIIKNKF